MKTTIKIAALLGGIVLSCQALAVTYTFSGAYVEPLPPGQSDPTATFTLSLPDFIVANTTVPAESMIGCVAPVTPCLSATFFVDAAAAGLTDDPGLQAVQLSTLGGYSGYYYFEAPAFSTSGTYASFYGFNPATLVVAIPEPATYALMLLGATLVGAVARRRRKT